MVDTLDHHIGPVSWFKVLGSWARFSQAQT
jgi:hypothetical protein